MTKLKKKYSDNYMRFLPIFENLTFFHLLKPKLIYFKTNFKSLISKCHIPQRNNEEDPRRITSGPPTVKPVHSTSGSDTIWLAAQAVEGTILSDFSQHSSKTRS